MGRHPDPFKCMRAGSTGTGQDLAQKPSQFLNQESSQNLNQVLKENWAKTRKKWGAKLKESHFLFHKNLVFLSRHQPSILWESLYKSVRRGGGFFPALFQKSPGALSRKLGKLFVAPVHFGLIHCPGSAPISAGEVLWQCRRAANHVLQAWECSACPLVSLWSRAWSSDLPC